MGRFPDPGTSSQASRAVLAPHHHREVPLFGSEPPFTRRPAVLQNIVELRAAIALVGRFPALAGVDLDVAKGEVVLLRGHNGAGKSTLLRMCAGLIPVASGSAVVLGHDLSRDRWAVRRRIGLLGHETFLYEDLTVVENLAFWSRAAGATIDDGMAALDRLGVPHRLHGVTVRSLSAGQRRRVSFASMIARRPELWLLDEPHAGLDQDGRDIVDELVREAVRHGVTVLFVSHELERAHAIADRRVTIAAGIIESKDPREVDQDRGDHDDR